jgi:acyl dehydratase
MLAVALTWPLSSQFDSYWGEIGFPEEARQRQVHYNESIQWQRPLRPDESITIGGEIVSMMPHPAGTLITMRYDGADRGDKRVFTEYITGILRDVSLTDGGKQTDVPPKLTAMPEDTEPQWSAKRFIDPLAAHVYDACTNIVFPIHTSVAFARLVGLPGPIYHGTATLGLAVRELLAREAEGDPTVLRAVHGGFRGMVLPGSTITIRMLGSAETSRERLIYFDVLNEQGGRALKNGRLHLEKPGQ